MSAGTILSSIFPPSMQVTKIKSDEREDLKVLATGVAAALAARKVCCKFWVLALLEKFQFSYNFSLNLQPSWVTDEEFGMGYLELKPAPSLAAKSSVPNSVALQSSSAISISLSEPAGGKASLTDAANPIKDQMLKTKPADGRLERAEGVSNVKSDSGNIKLKGGSTANGSDALAVLQSGTSRSIENQKQVDEFSNRTVDDNVTRVGPKNSLESEVFETIFQNL